MNYRIRAYSHLLNINVHTTGTTAPYHKFSLTREEFEIYEYE